MRTTCRIIFVLFFLQVLASGNAFADENSLRQLIASGDFKAALNEASRLRQASPDDEELKVLHARVLLELEQYGASLALLNELDQPDPSATMLREKIDAWLERASSSWNRANITIQNLIRDRDYDTALLMLEIAFENYHDKREDLHVRRGELLYGLNQLDEAEAEFREALKINPTNDVAKNYVEELRSTQEAQTSAEVAEWISIAKDKVGDFVVTFLALFAAFVVNNLISPIILQLKLNRARNMFEEGEYDEFTDLLEGLLDTENFTILRSNFRFVLENKGYEEAQEILNRYVVTHERLPTLLRILEREHEKMSQT